MITITKTEHGYSAVRTKDKTMHTTMKTTQHTPLPWRIADSSTIWSGDQPVCTIAHEENSNLSAEEADANQAFIVTACNAHEELLAACKVARAWLSKEESADLTKLDAAIAHAEGKE